MVCLRRITGNLIMAKYWIIVASKDHVMQGVSRGFAQAGHGKRSGLIRMHAGDGVVYYSPKREYAGREHLKAFTAIGLVEDEEIFQVVESVDFHPFRRRVKYIAVKDVPALPLVSDLTFIRNKRAWGFVMRFGLLEIPETDFRLIATAMGALLPAV